VTSGTRLAAGAVNLALALIFLITWAVEAVAVSRSWGLESWTLGGSASLLVALLALGRTRAPGAAAAAGLLVALLTVGAAQARDYPAEPGPAMALGLAVLTSAAIRALRPGPAAGVAAGGLTVVLATLLFARDSGAEIPFVTALNATCWLVGISVGVALRHRDDRARAGVEAIRREVRLEIARDLHDVVAHHVTGIVVQAQAGRLVGRDRPEVATEVLASIESAGTEALTSIRRVVGLLRTADDTTRGTHDLDRLAALVEQSRDHGFDVTLDIVGDLGSRSAEVTATLYRIVQEALTNITRHASGARCVEVRVRAEPDNSLIVDVSDDGPHQPNRIGRGGFGLIGMRERVQALGGELVVGPRPGAGWLVHAEIPIQREPAR
jgi:signal transduction histidine kinase